MSSFPVVESMLFHQIFIMGKETWSMGTSIQSPPSLQAKYDAIVAGSRFTGVSCKGLSEVGTHSLLLPKSSVMILQQHRFLKVNWHLWRSDPSRHTSSFFSESFPLCFHECCLHILTLPRKRMIMTRRDYSGSTTKCITGYKSIK